jgi:2,4-dienoyl-CoA reductase (NADPH2)
MASFIKEEVTDDIPPLIKYYETQLKRLGVTINLNTSVDVNLVDRTKPDVVVLAVGGEPLDTNIPVEKGANIKTTEELKKEASKILKFVGSKRMSQLTKIFMPVGKKVVVVGSDIAGLQTAEFLVKRGKEVTVVDEAKEIGEGMLAHWMIKLPPWLAQKNVSVFNGVKYKKITPKGVTFISKEGKETTITADTVMVINRYKANDALAKALKGKVPEIHIVGDAKSDKRAYIHGCIHEGARLGLAI